MKKYSLEEVEDTARYYASPDGYVLVDNLLKGLDVNYEKTKLRRFKLKMDEIIKHYDKK